VGQPLPADSDRIAQDIEKRYTDDGYTFAHVTAAFDEASGLLSLTIDEGVIDAVEFEGVGQRVAREFMDQFALRAGDVFNRPRAMHALNAMLRQTRGAISPGPRRGTFNLIERAGQRVLIVDLREPAGRFKVVPDFGEREDWFTPVDGFVPSLGFGAAVFDHEDFNHAFVAGHLSFKIASGQVGYALGFEKPLFASPKLFLGGELHDLTASDDQWQVSSNEASLASVAVRRNFRDYYRRRGVQINGGVRVERHVELLAAYKSERHENLAIQSDYSLWNSDELFRPNLFARSGRLSAVVVGASIDGEGFDRESLESSYRRHQLETPFGARLRDPNDDDDMTRVWRIDWTSEISTPGALQSDFDFRRHILSGRARLPLSEHQDVSVRAIGGWSGGVLPPQRQFALGGIGSVHGYEFKEAVGDTMSLVNLEYALGWRNGVQAIGFFDAGRVRAGSNDAQVLKGVGFGVNVSGFRVDFGYKLDDIPKSLQVLVRFERTF
ncbi:MAG TPA: BamA/TamA family outer membrane protein, partial [Vicinamibacterales bacterium]|nr:BamA/TamA family outer membrane protein [Vicinamibacterales bacterium]